MHYYPKNWDNVNFHRELDYAVPPHWADEWDGQEEDDLEELVMMENAMEEPECEDGWCSLKDSKKWTVKTELGQVESAKGKTELRLDRMLQRDEL